VSSSVDEELQKASSAIALAAIDSVDLVASLDAIAATEKDYEFEYLFGLFKFLSDKNAQSLARTVYGLELLPRLFKQEFKGSTESLKETWPYVEYIPKQLMSNTVPLDENRVVRSLQSSLLGARAETPRREDVEDGDWWRMLGAITKLTDAASPTVAASTANWLSQALLAASNHHWLIDGTMYQLFHRSEPLVEHKSFERYLMGSPCRTPNRIACRRSTLAEVRDERYGGVKTFKEKHEEVVVDRWSLEDFDLLIQLLNIQTRSRPDLSAADMSQRLAFEFKTLQNHIFNRNEIDLFKSRAIETINLKLKKTRKPRGFEDETKAALAALLDASDSIAGRGNWADFQELQHALAPLRVGARHPLTAAGTPEAAAVLKQYVSLWDMSRR